MKHIHNIIFDLGGVLLNIRYNKTSEAFKNLGILDFDTLYSQTEASPLFEELEVGKITPHKFFDEIRNITNIALTNEQITTAWNAMLLDFPIERLQLLQSLKASYKLFLYSNTNAIHYNAFQEIFKIDTKQNLSLDSFFDNTYYSHILGHRKPYTEGFLKIIQENNLSIPNTLFIDDTIQNIEAAKSLGIQTIHITSSLPVTSIRFT